MATLALDFNTCNCIAIKGWLNWGEESFEEIELEYQDHKINCIAFTNRNMFLEAPFNFIIYNLDETIKKIKHIKSQGCEYCRPIGG